MHYHNQIIRFQEGTRSPHPTPEASVTTLPPGLDAVVGEQLTVLVDLMPLLPHRSREIRAVAAKTYWSSSGSVVARLRRSLAEANRHLTRTNLTAPPGSKCTGSITCTVCFEDELFLGQIGAAYAFVQHPNGKFEVFPQRDRILMPLGVLPPVIHIGYATMAAKSIVGLATTPIAESQARERWQAMLVTAEPESLVEQVTAVMARSRASGSLLLTYWLPLPVTPPPAPTRGWWWLKLRDSRPTPPAARGTVYAAVPTATAENVDASTATETPFALRWPSLPESWRDYFSTEARTQRQQARTTTVEKTRLRGALRALLPGKIEGKTQPRLRPVPPEKISVMGGLTLGLFLIVFFITLTEYWQDGGAGRATAMLETAQSVRQIAYDSQAAEDWYRLLALSTKITTLDPQNVAALKLKKEARHAIDALEHAAVLDARLLRELGTAPTPRRLLIAEGWIYILNTATDEVIGIPLAEDFVTPLADAATSILRYGQTFFGETVEHLVDMAWIEPGGNYPDGAVFIYSDAGLLYIYEPLLGPGSITRQYIQGHLQTGMVTHIETFGDKIYLIQRQDNQIFTYEPVNGIYGLPRNYFPPNDAPYLQKALDIAIDGRVYLLMGDSHVQAYFSGMEDPTFKIQNLPAPDLQPIVLAIEPDPEKGLLYLGDSQRERIVVLNKRGEFMHQFRLPGEELQQLEALAVSESPHILYLIAANRLYAAPLPEFVTQ